MEVQDDLTQVQDEHGDDVMESLGVDEENHEEQDAQHEEPNHSKPSNKSLGVQKRLKAQRRQHEREVRELHARIGDLESRMNPMQSQSNNHYAGSDDTGNIEDHIHKAVSYALQQKDMEERKALEAKNMQHVHRQYQDFEKHLDNMGDKYEDFHDVVYGNHTPYTDTMRDYAMTLPRTGAGSAGEVLYKLGKNPKELERIRQLHPIDQSSEMARLSHALISGGENKSSHSTRPLGQIKNNPVSNSHMNSVNEKTPISSIRQRMKSGTWK